MSVNTNLVKQLETFEFNEENKKKAENVIAKYPAGKHQSAVLPLLDLAQRQAGGWLPKAAMDYVAMILGMAPIRVYEVASFYSMFNLKPVGKYHLQVCGTTPCWLLGAGDIMDTCKSKLGIGKGETTNDGLFSISEVECLGACVNAPILQVNDDYYEDMNIELTEKLLENLKLNHKPEHGSMVGRQCSAPLGFKKED